MIMSLIEGLVYVLNKLPSIDRVSDTLIPSTILEGIPKLDMGEKNVSFGLYVMVHIGTANTMKIICVPDILLKSSNNYGGYYYMSIFTRKRIHSYNCK